MKNTRLSVILLVLSILSGCASQSFIEGELQSKYKPVAIDGALENESAIIKVASGLSLWKVDGVRQVNGFKLLFKGGYDSILLKEGFHRISVSMGRDIHIGKTYYQKGHEYLIDYLKVMNGNSGKIHYWVKDITDGKIVYGKERFQSEFN